MGNRFNGWDENAIKDLLDRKTNTMKKLGVSTTKKKCTAKKKTAKAEIGLILQALRSVGFEPVIEKTFNPYAKVNKNNFRFDIAIEKHKIAIEYEGGVFHNGGHTRGATYTKNCHKYNIAQILGWRVLRYTVADTNKINWEFRVVFDVQELIKNNYEELSL